MDVNRFGCALVVFILICFNFCVFIFAFTLLLLHSKLYRLDLTAYEYLLYKRERSEKLEYLKDGIISQEEFDEEDKRCLEEIRKVKRSKIIHEVKQKDKGRYREAFTKSRGNTPSKQVADLEERKDKPIRSEEIRKTSLYYWFSAKMCTACTHRVDKSRRDHSNIQDRGFTRRSQIKADCDFDNVVFNDELELNKVKSSNAFHESKEDDDTQRNSQSEGDEENKFDYNSGKLQSFSFFFLIYSQFLVIPISFFEVNSNTQNRKITFATQI
jgi:hypothetical protein